MAPRRPKSTLIIIPVLGRPHRARLVFDSIEDTTPEPHRVLFVANESDTDEIDAVRAIPGAELMVMEGRHRPVDWERQPGDWAKKINRAYRESTEPLLFLAADDLLFHAGWLKAAQAKLRKGIGVVGTNDLGSPRVIAGLHATHVLVTREYATKFGTVDGPGQVLVECYPHEFVDDELVGTAKMRQAWAFAFDSHVEHLHPSWGKASRNDPIYRLQRDRMKVGRFIYEQRKAKWGE